MISCKFSPAKWMKETPFDIPLFNIVVMHLVSISIWSYISTFNIPLLLCRGKYRCFNKIIGKLILFIPKSGENIFGKNQGKIVEFVSQHHVWTLFKLSLMRHCLLQYNIYIYANGGIREFCFSFEENLLESEIKLSGKFLKIFEIFNLQKLNIGYVIWIRFTCILCITSF